MPERIQKRRASDTTIGHDHGILDSGELSFDRRLYMVETKERITPGNPTALITGVAGQDGSYMAEFLAGMDYRIVGVDVKGPDAENIRHIKDKITWSDVDISDAEALANVLKEQDIDEIYHLAASTHVGDSFNHPEETMSNIWRPALGVFTAAQLATQETEKPIRIYNALTSELFGTQAPPQSEDTPFKPRSPYAVAKQFVYNMAEIHKREYGQFITNGILFNHESPRRPENFVTRKVTMAAAKVAQGLEEGVQLGNLDAVRDWGHAFEYVQFMHQLMQADESDTVVIGTGEGHTVRELASYAFDLVGKNWEEHVLTDAKLYRPAEVPVLIADARKAKEKYGWEPNVRFRELIKMMVEHDMAYLEKQLEEEKEI